MSRARVVLVGWLAAVALGGCATGTSPAFPPQAAGLAVTVVPFAPGFDDLPPGSYRVANTSFAVKQHKPLSVTGAALEVLGVLGSKAAGKDQSQAIGESLASVLDVDVARLLAQRVAAELDPASMSMQPGLQRDGPPGPVLELRPWVLVASEDGRQGRLYCYLRARLVDHRGREQWWTRYSDFLPDRRPLTGDGSWAEQDGAAVRAALADAYGRLVRLLMRDLRGAEWTPRAATLLIEEPGLGEQRKLDALILSETGDRLVVTPEVKETDRLFGVHLISPGEVRVLSAD